MIIFALSPFIQKRATETQLQLFYFKIVCCFYEYENLFMIKGSNHSSLIHSWVIAKLCSIVSSAQVLVYFYKTVFVQCPEVPSRESINSLNSLRSRFSQTFTVDRRLLP